jgi:hypothetical protein
MQLLLVQIWWWLFRAGYKLVQEPNRIEHGVGHLARQIWETMQ